MLGEMGPGDNIGLIASKTSATGIRGEYYAIAAACGKIGAFIGNYIFPIIKADGGSNTVKQGQYPFFVASSLCLFSACIVWLLPKIEQDTIEKDVSGMAEQIIAEDDQRRAQELVGRLYFHVALADRKFRTY